MPDPISMPDNGNPNVNTNRCFFMPMPYNSKPKLYSTNEVKTDDVWIDGKPIYRKILYKQFNSYLAADVGWQLIEFDGIPQDLDHLVDTRLLGGTDRYNSLYALVYTVRSNGINVYWPHRIGYEKFCLILEYTKTTDQATITE